MDPLSGPDLDPYKVPLPTTCWWCGSSGPLTREHKFKRSDLTRMWDEAEGLMWGGEDELRQVRSARKSPQVRFEPSLCAKCNNQKSQPFDNAYQTFSDYVWDRPQLWRARYLDMADVYGMDWAAKTFDLARYIAKHIGCRMAHDGYPVPPSLAQFLNGARLLPDVHMVLFKSRDHHRLYRRGIREGVDARGLWISPTGGAVSRSRQSLSMYSSGLVVNFVGVMYRWEYDYQDVDPFYVYQHARLHKRHKLPVI